MWVSLPVLQNALPVIRHVLCDADVDVTADRLPGVAARLIEHLARRFALYINVESRPAGFLVEVWRPTAGQHAVKTIDAVLTGEDWANTVLSAVVMMIHRGVITADTRPVR